MNCCNVKVICAAEELLNGAPKWSVLIFRPGQKQSAVSRTERARPDKHRDKRRRMSLYRLSAAL